MFLFSSKRIFVYSALNLQVMVGMVQFSFCLIEYKTQHYQDASFSNLIFAQPISIFSSRKQLKKICGFTFFRGFSKFYINLSTHLTLHLIPSLVSCEVPQIMWAGSVQPFSRLLDTNKTPTKTSKVYICIYI